jgi:uncharacterized Zn-binding protein involved in type VI secretion
LLRAPSPCWWDACIGDMTAHGGVIVTGLPTVLIG